MGDCTVAAKLSENVSKSDGQVFECSYTQKVSPAMQVGTSITKAMKKDTVGLAFGCIYKMDKDTTVKAKVDAAGILSCSYKQVILKREGEAARPFFGFAVRTGCMCGQGLRLR